MSKKGFTYTLQIDAEINDLIAKTNQVKKSMQSIMDAGKAPGAEKIFGGIERAIERLQQRAAQPIESTAAFSVLEKDAASVGVQLKKLGSIVDGLGGMDIQDKLDLIPADLATKIEKASTALKAYKTAEAAASQKTEEHILISKRIAKAKEEEAAVFEKADTKQKLFAMQSKTAEAAKAEVDAIKRRIEALKEFQAAADEVRKKEGDAANVSKAVPVGKLHAARQTAPQLNLGDASAVNGEIEQLTTALATASKNATAASATLREYQTALDKANNTWVVASEKVEELEARQRKLDSEFEDSNAKKMQAAYSALRQEAGQLGIDLTNIPIEYTEQNFVELNDALNRLTTDGIAQVDSSVNQLQTEFQDTGESAERFGDKITEAGTEVENLDKQVKDTEAFTQRIAQFVGLQGGIEIARNAMRNAMNTIKELDATITEMAVVTELDVGDYWDQLPEYTARANALGVSIKSAYESATLYYQQGLKTNEVVAMSNQTLKMARIAGLSAEDATNKMTAALRGFNMELNETSAQRVADVYSELAAITASDVDEISSAMTKTASIAASAGMEFETTAAFLSQIIETTRESAETAGTALKTVIARFQELKKDPSEIGEVDGEIVDANKIETALRSVGVSLRDTRGQFRELDDVFLELSGKWDDLDTNTQRYIATIAAGSRQQSRFIAMMSDYSRTQELVAAANSSAGASNEQFEKTMDSLESKLNELKNAWDSFTMGIMNSDLLKAGIDLLTGILTAINNITDAFGEFGGAAKIGLLVAALYLGDKALKVFMGSLQGCGSVFGAFGATGRAALDSINKRFVSLKKLFSAKLNIKIGSEQLYKATQATKAHSQATRELQSIETQRAAAAKAGALTDAQAAMYSQQAAEATAMQSAAEKELMATMGLSAMQLETVSALEALNVATGDALILTKAGISTATLTEISAINKKTVAENASTLAQNLSNASGIRAISAKIGLTVANWAQTASEKAKTGSLWASVTATIAQAMANWGLQASMWPILVIGLLIVAAFAALVVIVLGLVAAFKAWKANSPEGRMEALREKTEAAKEAAEDATKAYKDLLELHDSYASLVSDVENLTTGTTEWKEAVVKLNEKIAELLDLYPQLAKYVSFTENGVMYIEEAGWDELLNQQTSKARLAKANQYYQENRQNREAAEQILDSQDKNAEKLKKKGRKLYSGKNTNEVNWMVESLQYDDWGSESYNEHYSQLQKLFAGNKEMLEIIDEMNDAAKARTDLENQANADMKMSLWSLGSETAQKDQNYGRIINSLAPYYAYDSGLVSDTGKANAYKWQEGSTIYWNEGSNSSNAYLQAELAKYGLISSKNEKYDMAALLAAKGGTAYTEDEIDDMGKKADDNLSQELDEIYGLEARGKEVVDEIYNLSQTDSLIGELYGGSLDTDLKAIDKHISDNYFGKGGLTRALEQRIKDIEQARADVDLELQKIYDNEQLTALDFTDSYDSAQEFVHTYNEMLSGVGAGLATSFAELFADFDANQQQSFFTDYGNINWSSSIEGAATLKEMLESDNVALQEFATKTLALESATYSATAQMNEFYKSLSPDTLQELAADGKIAATEILEMAKFNDKLATMMDTTGVSAAALGHYYELLEDGTISAYEATTNFTKALSEMNAASNIIEDSFAFIDTFEPSRSQTEISEYFSGMRESAMELYDMGAYGDQQLQDYIEGFLGEDTWKKMIEDNAGDMKAAMDQAMAQINTYGENLYGTWQQLATQGLQGVSMGEDGAIQFNLEEIGNVENLKQQIMDMGWSDAMADALIADAQTFSAELGAGLKTVDIEKGLQTWLSEAMQINGKTIIPKGQVKAMAKELGTTVEQLTADLQSKGVQVMDLFGEDGLLGEDMRKQIIETAKAAGEFDLDTNYQLLLELGLDDKEAKEELKGMAGSLTNVPFKLNGETIQRTGEVVYDSTGAAVENSSSSGLIDGLVDPKVKAAQELSALEQGEMMAKANATGSIVASRVALQASAEGIDNLINGAIDILNYIPGVNISESNLAGSVASGTEALVGKATGQIESMNNDRRSELQGTINKTTDKADYSDIAADLADKYTNDTDKIVGAYENGNAQESGVVQEEVEDWENPYDELYNLNHKLNAAIREREKLERDYERAVEDSSKSAQDLAAITADELLALEKEAGIQKDIADQALENAEAKITANSQYAGLYSFDKATGEVTVDWEKAGQEGWTSEEGQEFEDFISYLEEQGDAYREAQDSLEVIEDQVDEIEKRGRDSTSEIYNQVKEGLIKERQEEIDKLQAINDAIQDAQSALVDQMQRQIDEARQARDNEKTENEIADKETRLAYLMRDTSGGNAMEIASLQKEIEEAKQEHTDSLVDQQLQSLQDANDKAAEQRQKQIDLAQMQLDSYANSAEIWSEVKGLVDAGFAAVANGTAFENTTAGQLAASGADVDTLNPFEKEDFYMKLERNAKEGAIHEGFVGIQGNGSVTSISSLARSINDTIGGLEMNVTTTATGAVVTTTVPAYKEGGLADYTGPAWLDGTKSHPELVLNQRDTANFIQLKDILAEVMNRSTADTKSKTTGDNYFEIAINVDSIESDYDVEQIADKIRDMIYQDATYRNVNAINWKK